LIFCEDFIGEEGISENSNESLMSAFMLKSRNSSQNNSPFVIKPKKVQSDEVSSLFSFKNPVK